VTGVQTCALPIYLITDAHGTPLAVTLTGGNRNDITELIALVDAVPAIRGVVGRPRRYARRLYADQGNSPLVPGGPFLTRKNKAPSGISCGSWCSAFAGLAR
jgi:hypothetical protein